MRTVPEDLDGRFKIVTAVCELTRHGPVVSLGVLVVPKQKVNWVDFLFALHTQIQYFDKDRESH